MKSLQIFILGLFCSVSLFASLQRVPFSRIKPTQLLIGKLQLQLFKEKFAELQELSGVAKEKKLKKEAGQAILGPGNFYYLVDGHHHARAFLELKETHFWVEVLEDWSDFGKTQFWKKMQKGEHGRPYLHIKDEQGRAKRVEDLPDELLGMKDSPLRSAVFLLAQVGIIHKKGNKDFPRHGEFDIAEWLYSRVEMKKPHSKAEWRKLLRESAYLLTAKENQSAELPGQIQLSRRDCDDALEDIDF